MYRIHWGETMFEQLKIKKELEKPGTLELADQLLEEAKELKGKKEQKTAEKMCIRAYEIYNTLNTNEPGMYKDKLAVCCSELGDVYENMEMYDKAREYHSMAAEIYEEMAENKTPEFFEALSDEYCSIGDTHFFNKMYDEADEFYRKALDIVEKLEKEYPGMYIENIAYCHDCLAKNHCGRENYTLAVEEYEYIIGIYQKLLDEQHTDELNELTIAYNEELASVYNDIGYTYSCCKDMEDAEKYYQKAAFLYRLLTKNDPDTYATILADQYSDLAVLYEDMNDKYRAKEYRKKALNPYV